MAKDATELSRAQPSLAPLRLVENQEWLDFSEVFSHSPARGVEEAAGYALCVLHAEAAQEAYLLFGTDAAARVWLNGERLHENRVAQKPQGYDNAIPLNLHRGDNLLLIKTVSSGHRWTFKARLEPDLNAAVRMALSLNTDFFKQSLVAPGQALELNPHGLPAAAHFEGVIARYDGTPVRAAEIGPGQALSTAGLAEGLYRFVPRMKGTQPVPSPVFCADPAGPVSVFYIGSYEELYESMRERVATLAPAPDERTRINLDAYLRRLEIVRDSVQASLAKAGEQTRTERLLVDDAEHKALYAATALDEILDHLARGEEPFRHRPGLHLRGFRSGIDDQPMYYRLFVPSRYRADAAVRSTAAKIWPLFILPPSPFEKGCPFLQSVFVADQRTTEMWARAAEELGVILLWPGYRVGPYGNPIDFAHFEEVLAAVRADYRIDRTRIYLQGSCGAALFNAMEVRRHPKRYAALVMVNPVLHRRKGRLDERAEFRDLKGYRAWLRATDPVVHFEALAETPIRIVHDGADPDHGPLADSVELVNALRGMPQPTAPIEFVRRRPQPWWAIRDQAIREQIAWACERRREDASDELGADAKAEPLSVAAVLSERFIVVRGTGGTAEERTAAARWCEEFCTAWTRTAFVPCRVVDDVALAESEWHESNLVLIGSPSSNRVWQQLAASLPLTMTSDRVEISGQVYRGSALGVQAAFTNPAVPARQVLLIGSAAPEAEFGTMELALDGWFRCAIWEPPPSRLPA